MAKKRERFSDKTDSAEGDRDLVLLYARLTQTLESILGDALAVQLAGLRQSPFPEESFAKALPAMGRAFRRLGLMDAGADGEAFARGLAARTGDAVNRPAEHILFLWALFCRGEPEAGLKAVCGAAPDCRRCGLTRECDYYNNPRTPAMALLSPAERLLSGDDRALSDAELLAVFLFGEKADGQEEVVGTLLARYGRLRALFRADAHEYRGIRDMGKPQTLRLAAAAALHRRLLAERRDALLHISSARDLYDRYAAELRDFQVEAAVLVLLDQQNNVVRDVWYCDGSPTMAHIAVPDLLRAAVREYAPRVALIHNHPSDNAAPSQADKDFTRRLRSGCDLLGLGLVDHVIVCESGYFSFAEEGMLGI